MLSAAVLRHADATTYRCLKRYASAAIRRTFYAAERQLRREFASSRRYHDHAAAPRRCAFMLRLSQPPERGARRYEVMPMPYATPRHRRLRAGGAMPPCAAR